MKNLTGSIEGGVIGQITAASGDYAAFSGLQQAAEFGAVPITILNSPYRSPELDWAGTPPDELAAKVQAWITAHHITTVVGPAPTSEQPNHPLAARVIEQAVGMAVQETGGRVALLSMHRPDAKLQGWWTTAANGWPNLLMPANLEAPRIDSTYTLRIAHADLGRTVLHTINPGVQPVPLIDPISLDEIY